MKENLIYKIKKDKHDEESLQNTLKQHKEIKFISLMAIDLAENATDERIPIKIFLENLNKFLYGTAVQTDGSSVDLPEIATINDAKVDMIIDRDCDWFIDYNEDLFDEEENLPVGTIIIPAFLHHKGKPVDSRSILKETIIKTKEEILNLIKTNSEASKKYNLDVEYIDENDNNDWQLIEEKRRYVYKDSIEQKSLFFQIYDAFDNNEWEKASDLVIELEEKMEELRFLYSKYSKNVIE